MKLHGLGKNARGTAVFGCIWKKGEITAEKAENGFCCTNEAGENVEMQSRITAYWPDGSVKWTAHSADSRRLGDSISVTGNFSGSMQQCGRENLTETEDTYVIEGTGLEVVVSKRSGLIFESVKREGDLICNSAKPVLILEERSAADGGERRTTRRYVGTVKKVTLEETGPVQTILKFEGAHVCRQGDRKGDEKIPFVIRMFVGASTKEIRFQHTFLYDGDENRDFLKGIGIEFDCPLSGELYNRHVKFAGDAGTFHEVSMALSAWRPRIPEKLYEQQINGECIDESALVACGDDELKDKLSFLEDNAPHWDSYSVVQDSAEHFVIRKKLGFEDVCRIDALCGRRSAGGCAFGSEGGSVMIAVRDFWEKYPGGITVSGLTRSAATADIWFYSPEAESYDFRHYAHRGYNQVCYEGYDYKGADPVGIACTSECAIGFGGKVIPSDKELIEFADNINHPAIYVADPEFYHEMRAFGYWSLPGSNTEVEKWLESQLDSAFDFYRQEVDQRGWYGLFNYGDFMHTYDRHRHQWKYDVGGYAWDNTELVPTLWLWNFFLRTGREDVFSLAEKLSRHASEVDVYHFGKYKGLGSRHNVRHWGCPCKEARIAMAAHHRVFYYLTGDRRFEDIFEELKDNEVSFLNKDPLGDFYDKEQMQYPSHARSGPDWSSLVSNWMTEWERKNDKRYRDKIMTGLMDLEKAPLRLASGPDFEFDPKTLHLRYIGERTTGGTHLQVCMGAPGVWMETADLLDYPAFNTMLTELGRFALLPRDEQLKECGGLIGEREYTFPFMFSGLSAYASSKIMKGEAGDIKLGADKINNSPLSEGRACASRTWKALLSSLLCENNAEGFKSINTQNAGNHSELKEIPWITTNFTAQWCLNVTIALDFIGDELPKTMGEAMYLVKEDSAQAFRRA